MASEVPVPPELKVAVASPSSIRAKFQNKSNEELIDEICKLNDEIAGLKTKLQIAQLAGEKVSSFVSPDSDKGYTLRRGEIDGALYLLAVPKVWKVPNY